MKVGIILYSKTKNTLSVAKTIEQKLKQNNIDITIEEITVSGKPENNVFEITNYPKINYDYIIFAAPVNGFSLCNVLVRYLESLPDLSDKKISGFVTQFFPYPWMGGNRSIKMMNDLVNSKKGNLIKTGVINWKNKKKEMMVTDLVNNLYENIKIGG